MSNPAIKVEGLGKEYIIGGAEFMATSFREMLTDAFTAPFKRFSKLSGKASEAERFWALRDVSFNIQQGEVVGIIGRNGAGKSTLLKILCRITAPTCGRIELEGRVASLLEVGTGFHPELTGSENIYLNGAILGMKQAEIKRKFDEIVDFAEIEKFLDTPVKRYSSGMYVRLAFAVAAHLDPEILLVDEVLAVGDIAFQEKCIGKMGRIAKEGRTVLFISHNMGAIKSLTDKCIYIKNGLIENMGPTENIIKEYVGEVTNVASKGTMKKIHDYAFEVDPEQSVKIVNIEVAGINPLVEKPIFNIGDRIKFKVTFESKKNIHNANVTVRIYNNELQPILTVLAHDSKFRINLLKGTTYLNCSINNIMFLPGKYFIDIGLNLAVGRQFLYSVKHYPGFEIVNTGKKMLQHNPMRPGVITTYDVTWEITNEH